MDSRVAIWGAWDSGLMCYGPPLASARSAKLAMLKSIESIARI
ncbi:hypothetical protein NYG90_05750 [Helicobacter sp. XJK30-2]|uniref:Uncharacterized protein n=1 Tax=Helicobacter zhangjianzhongii TaxID=2974574 RepID=A0ACC6FSC4_9HELI|nr:hypothetical protein [Helicobacter sp. XJK30-2]MDL0079727.1 hypothetical protein [Helicobacter sp. CPD2-1]MDL0082179.1 hypothetical protein [Helicobacter sp. XJK30-2]